MLKPGAALDYMHGKRACTGTVWCNGPSAGTYWVQPAPGARAVLVKVPTATQRGKGQRATVVESASTPAERRALLQRCSAISKAGTVFGAADPQQLTLNGEQAVTYHVDEQCTALAGKVRVVRYGRLDTLPAYRATDVLLGKRQPDIALCAVCIHGTGEAA